MGKIIIVSKVSKNSIIEVEIVSVLLYSLVALSLIFYFILTEIEFNLLELKIFCYKSNCNGKSWNLSLYHIIGLTLKNLKSKFILFNNK